MHSVYYSRVATIAIITSLYLHQLLLSTLFELLLHTEPLAWPEVESPMLLASNLQHVPEAIGVEPPDNSRDVTSIEAEETFASSLFGKGQG